MASWMTEWAEKGGTLLNSLDTRVANLLKNDGGEGEKIPNSTPQRKVSLGTVEPQKSNGIFSPAQQVLIIGIIKCMRFCREVISSKVLATSVAATPKTGTSDTQLFEFLNSPVPMEQALSTLESTSSSPLLTKPPEPSNSHVTPAMVTKNSSDTVMENQLLHQEIASLNQEIAELVRRNKRAETEAQQRSKEPDAVFWKITTPQSARFSGSESSRIDGLRGQVQSLKTRLEEAKRKAATLQQSNSASSSGSNVKFPEVQIEKLTKSLISTRQALTESESKASEALKLADISSSRVEQLQQEITRLTLSLSSYKEKATAILSDKEKVISELRNRLNKGDSSDISDEDANLRREYEQLQEETITLRQEAEQRLLAASEMEERAVEEHASLRRTISLLEQQLQREKQLVADSDAEIIDLQRRLNVAEETSKQELASMSGQLRSAEAEVLRLRRSPALVDAPSSPTGTDHAVTPISPSTGRNVDAEAKIFELEAKARQLNDSLLTKQDALEATLAQNHALKIRLERLEAESDAHLLDSGRSASKFANGYPQFPQSSPSRSPHGFARLHLIDTSLPGWLRGLVGEIDDWMIRFVAMLRRRPMIRILLMLYFSVFHVWLLCSLLLFTPPMPSPHPP
ncbi:hypothetical protein Aperf_G00000058025 [Anoplocephala perfoliata]